VRSGQTCITLLRNDTDPEVRAEAAYALGRRGDLNAVQALLDLAEGDPDDEVGRAALWALVEIACATKDRTVLERARAIDPVETARLENQRKRQIQVTREV